MSKIKWQLPGKTTPGFLKRRRELAALLDLEPTPENLARLDEYLEQYVEEGDLGDISELEFSQVILKLMGYGSTVDPKKKERSGQQ